VNQEKEQVKLALKLANPEKAKEETEKSIQEGIA
jgi:hypothetical protein